MGPSKKENGNNFSRLLFDREETKYEILETKFKGYLHTLGLKGKNLGRDETEKGRNEEAYASDNGREALRI